MKKWIAEEKKRREGAFKDKIVQDAPLGAQFDEANSNRKEEFDGKIPESNFYHSYSDEDLEKILTRQKGVVDALKKHDKPKFLAVIYIFL